MGRPGLRRRLTALFLRWLILILLIAGGVMALSFSRLRSAAVEERILLGETLARYLDASISGLFHDLQRVAAEPAFSVASPERLRAFRFRPFFRDAIYVVDARGDVLTADPAAVEPIAGSELRSHELVTTVLAKRLQPVSYVALVQPFRHRRQQLFLVSEMALAGSAMSRLLASLSRDPDVHLYVVDARGAVVAAPEPNQLAYAVPGDSALCSSVGTRSTHVGRNDPCWVCDQDPHRDHVTVMVPLRFAPWGVVVQQPGRRVFSAVVAARTTLLGTLGLMTAMALLLLRALSSSLISPLRDLSRQADRLRRGDLSQRIAVEGDREIELLAAAMDDARGKLQRSLAELGALNENLEEEVSERTAEIERLLAETLAKDAERRSLVRRLLAGGEEERKRIARELHDEISQLLTVVQLSLDGIPGSEKQLRKAGNLLTLAQKELHRIIYDLRPSLLDDLGLSAAVKWYAENVLSPRGLQVRLEVEEDMRLPPEVEITTFRIYQEIVTNVLRHSRAENVSIELFTSRDKVVLMVEDDGCGFSPEHTGDGFGIAGMRERAAIVGGRIRIDSAPAMGTQVVVEIPLAAGAGGQAAARGPDRQRGEAP